MNPPVRIKSPRTVLIAFLIGLAALCSFATGALAADPTFPALSGRVVDQAQILAPETIAGLETKLARLEADTGDQLVVVTLDSLQGYEIEDFGYRLGRAWGIGAKENDSGVLLIVAPNERKVRLEVGYGLEPVLTDALSNHIIQTDILPPFREGGYARGINAGVDSVIAQLTLDPAEAEARAAAAEPSAVEIPWPAILVIGLMFVFLFLSLLRAAGGRGKRRRRRGGVDPILVWGAAEILSGMARGGRSGGGGWSSGGGGGFSGGGGSFGGGGASGGW